MASIETVTPDELRRLLSKASEAELVAQMITQNGALHALNYLQRSGVTAENVAKLIEDIEDNIGVINQMAAERGLELPITLIIP